jgi:hypothetical protein
LGDVVRPLAAIAPMLLMGFGMMDGFWDRELPNLLGELSRRLVYPICLDF